MRKIYVAIVFIFLFGCNKEKISYAELTSFVSKKENGLSRSEKIGKGYVSVIYRPTDLLVHQELDGLVADKSVIDSLRKKYSSHYYFILSLSVDNKEVLDQVNGGYYGDIVQTMSFRMPQHVMLTTASQDTIPVADFMLDRTFNLGKTTDLIFAFSKRNTIQTDWVQFNLDEFGLGFGNSQFRFFTKDLEGTPSLNFYQAD
jgi:hypothetical protein